MKTKEEIFGIVQDITSDLLGQDKEDVKMESNFSTDLGADSLDKVELIMEVEKQLDIQIEDSAADEIQTVENLVDFITTKFN